MSRKDTIIIAVLVNAGLLIVLFASALKSERQAAQIATNPNPVVQEIKNSQVKKTSTPVIGDEIDQAIRQYAAAMPDQKPTKEKSFAEDLQAFAPVQTTQVLPSSSSQSPSEPKQNLAQALPHSSVAAPVSSVGASHLSAQQEVPEFIEVKVKKGDVLEKLARYHQTTVVEIMKTNQLPNTNLKIGQVLKISNPARQKNGVLARSSSHTTMVIPDVTQGENGTKYYTVKKGDNPWTIAVKNHMKVDELLKLNHLSEEEARRLKPGDQLRIQ